MKYVVGDIHGEISKLQHLMNHLEGDAEELIFVGDYINKGENSREVLNYLQHLMYNTNTTFLLGNHDFAWIEFAREGRYKDYLLHYGGRKTLDDFGLRRLIREEIQEMLIQPYQDFFDSLQNYCIREDHIVSHAGVHPDSWKEGTLTGAEKALSSLPAQKFLYNRQNFLEMDISHTDYYWVFGHTAFHTPYSYQRKRGIDTGAAYHADAPLTAYCIETHSTVDHRGSRESLVEDSLPLTWSSSPEERQ